MYEVTVEQSFSAAHRHVGVDGERPLHGHDFLVRVRLRGAELVEDVLVDFHVIELELARQLAELSYRDLSEHPEFLGRDATPAALARWIFDRMAPAVRSQGGVELSDVEVRDTEWSSATYAADASGTRPTATGGVT